MTKKKSSYTYFFKAPLGTKEVAVIAINSPLSLGECPTSFPCPSRKAGEQHPDLQYFAAGKHSGDVRWGGNSTQPFSWALSAPFSPWLIMIVLCKHS